MIVIIVFDPSGSKLLVWFFPLKDPLEAIWLPRQDQLHEICIEFNVQNTGISRFEAFFIFRIGIQRAYVFSFKLFQRLCEAFEKQLSNKPIFWRLYFPIDSPNSK